MLLTSAFLTTARADEIKFSVGIITSLSGELATIGTAVRNGVELARADFPSKFARFEFVYQDFQFDAKQAISAYRTLHDVKDVDVLIVFSNVAASAIGPLAERDRIPIINLNFDATPAIGKNFTVRSLNHTDEYMAALAAHLKTVAQEKFPVVRTDAAFFTAMVDSLRRALSPSVEIEDVAVFDPGDNDFRSTISRLKKNKNPLMGLFLFPDQLLAFARQAREQGLQTAYFGTDLCETAAVLGGDSHGLEGCLYPDNEVTADFRRRYQETFENEAQLTFAASAYDSTILLEALLHDLTEFDPSLFLGRIAAVTDRDGVLGRYSFRQDKSVGKYLQYPVYVKRIAGKRGVVVSE